MMHDTYPGVRAAFVAALCLAACGGGDQAPLDATQVRVPDAVGLPLAQARSIVRSTGLAVGTESDEPSDEAAEGHVIRQVPAAGTSVDAGSAVDLVVSTGPSLVTVPDVTGTPLGDAESTLTSTGLAVGSVSEQASALAPDGIVLQQDPGPGAQVPSAAAVDLVVSSGPPESDFSDEFESNSLSEWSLRHEVEGSSPQYTLLDVDQTLPGRLVVDPTRTPGWFGDADAPLIFKLLSGNFAVHTSVTTSSRANPGSAPGSNYNSAGLMARNPAGASGPENHIMVNVGTQNSSTGSETKTTVDSSSELFLDAGSNSGELVLCRIGDEFSSFRRLEGESSWTRTYTFARPDLPETLQVGMVVNAFGSPADLRAAFEFIRLLPTPSGQDDCLPG